MFIWTVCVLFFRLVENVDGPVAAPTKAELLLKAVKECVIGRHFIFGIKVQVNNNQLKWFLWFLRT